MRRRPLALLGLPFLLITGAPSLAAAEGWVAGVDLDYVRTIPRDDNRDGENGGGFHGRFGYQFDALLLYLRPEIGGSPMFFEDHTDWRAYGGARFGLLTGLSPGIYAHLGHGWYGAADEETGVTYDAGVLLDLTIFPFLNLGLHGGWVGNPDPVDNWINGGFHGEIFF